MIISWARIGRSIYYKWKDHEYQVRAFSILSGNKVGGKRALLFNLFVLSFSDHLLLPEEEEAEWELMRVRDKEIIKMYKEIEVNRVLQMSDLEMVKEVLKFYD